MSGYKRVRSFMEELKAAGGELRKDVKERGLKPVIDDLVWNASGGVFLQPLSKGGEPITGDLYDPAAKGVRKYKDKKRRKELDEASEY